MARAALENELDSIIDFEHLHNVLRKVDLYTPCGSVARISGLTVESLGPRVAIGELCAIEAASGKTVLAEAIGFRNNHLILLPLEYFEGVSPGDRVKALKTPRAVPVGKELLGRVLDGLGRPIDNKGPVVTSLGRFAFIQSLVERV
jgi:flagellum-specific ATP synthase